MNTIGNSEAELEHLVRARYPLISVVSWEEATEAEALTKPTRTSARSTTSLLTGSSAASDGNNRKLPAEVPRCIRASEAKRVSGDNNNRIELRI